MGGSNKTNQRPRSSAKQRRRTSDSNVRLACSSNSRLRKLPKRAQVYLRIEDRPNRNGKVADDLTLDRAIGERAHGDEPALAQ